MDPELDNSPTPPRGRPLTAEELREVQLDVLDRFLAWCDGQGLQCTAAYGTLLGAARHQGFIPWDDDVDLMMPRADYERLREHARIGDLEVGGRRDDAHWPYPNVKICDPRARVTGENPYRDRAGEGAGVGVNVDVFPIDTVPGGLLRRLQDPALRLLTGLAALQVMQPREGRSRVNRALTRILIPAARLLPRRLVLGALSRTARLATTGAEAGVLVGSYQWTVPIGDLAVGGTLPFEGRRMPVPTGTTAVLTAKYGPDHLTPPPPEARVTHHAFTARWA